MKNKTYQEAEEFLTSQNESRVGLILDQHLKKRILEYCQLSEIILVVKLKGEPFNISVIVAYAQQHKVQKIKKFKSSTVR